MNKTIRGTNKEERGNEFFSETRKKRRRRRRGRGMYCLTWPNCLSSGKNASSVPRFEDEASDAMVWMVGPRIAEETDFNAITTCLSHKKLAES